MKWLFILGLLAPISTTYAAERIYVTNEREGSVSVIDPSTEKVIQTIPVGKRPRGIHLSPDGKFAYVALSGTPITKPGDERPAMNADKSADGIGEIDLSSGKLITKIDSGSDPEQFDLTRDGKFIFVSNEDANAASLIDLAQKSVIKTFPVGSEPEGVTVSPDGKLIFVTSETTNDIHVIDIAARKIVGHFKTEQRPRGVAFTLDGAKAYITCETGGAICVADVAAMNVVKVIKPEGKSVRPMGETLSPDGKHLYVTTGRFGAVIFINTSDDQIEKTIPNVGARPWGIGVSPDGSTLYTANGPSNDVSVIDAASASVKQKIKAGDSPWGIAIAK